MFIQLLNNGRIVLEARTDHTPDKSFSVFLPVTYEGDTSLVKEIHVECIPSILESDFSLAARKHGLSVGGDYKKYIIRKSLTLPERPPPGYVDSLGPEDIIY